MAPACLFLATKVEEEHRQLNDIVTTFDYVKKVKCGHDKTVIDLNSFEFTDAKQSVVEAERYILKEIGFAVWQLQDDSSHLQLVSITQQL